MGQFSVWHWVVVLVLVGAIVLVVRAVRRSGPADARELHGIKGWLLLFVVGLTVLSPLMGLGQTAAAFADAERRAPVLLSMEGWSNYKSATWVLLMAAIAWQWRVVWGLTRHRVPLSVRQTQRFLLLAPGLIVLGDIVLATTLMDLTAPAEWVAGLFKGYVASAVWYAYFARSRRVRNTYGLAPLAPSPQAETPQAEAPQPAATQPVARDEGQEKGASERPLEDRLAELKRLFEAGLINQQEYETKKASLIQTL